APIANRRRSAIMAPDARHMPAVQPSGILRIMKRKTATIRLLSLCQLALIMAQTAESATPAALQIVTPAKSHALDLRDMKAKLETHLVEIDDPIYHSRKTYDGFLLTDIFKMADFTPDQAADEIIFTAMDGYSPNVSFEAVQKHVAYLVFQEHGKREAFEPVQQGKTQLSPGPYYLVWQEGS